MGNHTMGFGRGLRCRQGGRHHMGGRVLDVRLREGGGRAVEAGGLRRVETRGLCPSRLQGYVWREGADARMGGVSLEGRLLESGDCATIVFFCLQNNRRGRFWNGGGE